MPITRAVPRTLIRTSASSARVNVRARTRCPKPRRGPAATRSRIRGRRDTAASGSEHIAERADNGVDVFRRGRCRQRQRKGRVGDELGVGKLASPESEALRIERMEMQGTEMNAGADTRLLQCALHVVSGTTA